MICPPNTLPHPRSFDSPSYTSAWSVLEDTEETWRSPRRAAADAAGGAEEEEKEEEEKEEEDRWSRPTARTTGGVFAARSSVQSM